MGYTALSTRGAGATARAGRPAGSHGRAVAVPARPALLGGRPPPPVPVVAPPHRACLPLVRVRGHGFRHPHPVSHALAHRPDRQPRGEPSAGRDRRPRRAGSAPAPCVAITGSPGAATPSALPGESWLPGAVPSGRAVPMGVCHRPGQAGVDGARARSGASRARRCRSASHLQARLLLVAVGILVLAGLGGAGACQRRAAAQLAARSRFRGIASHGAACARRAVLARPRRAPVAAPRSRAQARPTHAGPHARYPGDRADTACPGGVPDQHEPRTPHPAQLRDRLRQRASSSSPWFR